ncbi:putative laccase TilA [Dendryphion nanum]|uniref:Laccase TilA n=1 Tax=Dendryphion nanum TaxID=256645 RepID=A0A9P9ED97_9PLEO|nr:putative laccase TilA [Dendryphion nanum]
MQKIHSLTACLLGCATLAFAHTSKFTLELTWKVGSPDGFARDMIFINGQFPGPILEINQDDWVEITVVNKLPFNTTIHAHGIEQLNTAWADGVPGLNQLPIQPGHKFEYKWHANQYGSYFYHAHSQGQVEDGAFGPIIIRPKRNLSKPFNKISTADVELLEQAERRSKPILLSDWRHTTSQRTWDLQVEANLETSICLDSIIVNGKGAVDCWSREHITQFTNPGIAPLLEQTKLRMTDKGCLPPQIFPILLPGTEPNYTALPQETFEKCTSTNGRREVINVSSKSKWAAFDVISAAGIHTFNFGIDEHPVWIYAIDGHYIEPVKVDVIPLSNGDRFSIFVQLNKPAQSYGIRVSGTALAQLIDTTAVLTYDGKNISDSHVVTSKPFINRAGGPTSETVTVFNQTQMVSFPPQFPQPPPEPAQTFKLAVGNAGNSILWALNHTVYNHQIHDSNPPLQFRNPDTIPDDHLLFKTKNNTWVDIILTVPELSQPPHPIHKHSNKVFILGQGEGAFNWTTVAQAAAAIPQNFNFKTPAFRDSFVTPPTVTKPTWVAVRYHVVNPGVFMLHCHIQSHLNGGMSMTILDGVDEWPKLPLPSGCKA